MSREEARRAYERLRPRIMQLPEDELSRPSLQVSRAVGLVLAVQPRIEALVPEMKKRLPDFDVEKVHELRALALAAYYAHLGPIPEEADRKVRDLAVTGAELRSTLLLEAEALAARRLLPRDQVVGLRGGRAPEPGERLGGTGAVVPRRMDRGGVQDRRHER